MRVKIKRLFGPKPYTAEISSKDFVAQTVFNKALGHKPFRRRMVKVKVTAGPVKKRRMFELILTKALQDEVDREFFRI